MGASDSSRVSELFGDIERFYRRVTGTWWFAWYFPAAVLFSAVAGVGWGNRFTLPLLVCLSFWPAMIVGINENGYWTTFVQLVYGYLFLLVVIISLTTWLPLNTPISIWYGNDVLQATLGWVHGNYNAYKTVDFLRIDFIETILAGILSALSGGAGGLAVTAGVVDIIGFQSGMLYSQSSKPFATLFFSIMPWEIVKSISLIFLTMAFSGPMGDKLLPPKGNEGFNWNFLYFGFGGIIAAMAMRGLLGGIWQEALARTLRLN